MRLKKTGVGHHRNSNQKKGEMNGHLRRPISKRREQLEQGARRINRKARQYMRDERFSWHVLFVPFQKEYITQKIISQWIAAHKFSSKKVLHDDVPFGCVYLPLNARWRRENRFTKKKKRFAFPVIPGCLFYGTQGGGECWYDLLKLHVVSGVLSVANEPMSICGKDLEQFVIQNRQKIENRQIHPFGDGQKPLIAGDKANVIDGSFERHLVDIQAVDGESANILLNFLGGNHEVEIALDRLKVAS